MEWLRPLWHFDNCFTVYVIDIAGGLAMLWMNDIDLNISSYFQNHIDATITSTNSIPNWRINGFYSQPNANLRHTTWSLLRNLAQISISPWLCLGDYNEIICNNKKLGGNTRPESQMEMFWDIIADATSKNSQWKVLNILGREGVTMIPLWSDSIARLQPKHGGRLFQTHMRYISLILIPIIVQFLLLIKFLVKINRERYFQFWKILDSIWR